MNKPMLIILVVALVLVSCSARPQFGLFGPSGTGAGFGTGNSGLFGGASASGGRISSANNGGFGVGSGSGSSFGGGLFGQHATGTGSGFSFGK
uniref:Uncharacterized protein n=1 Tax=Daphnia galeata TaxID=27404 RepID=A0A8J2WA54_9CRUS|nr:unnamed protein product [Daphnia galeata]